jgi:hypothetical protein
VTGIFCQPALPALWPRSTRANGRLADTFGPAGVSRNPPGRAHDEMADEWCDSVYLARPGGPDPRPAAQAFAKPRFAYLARAVSWRAVQRTVICQPSSVSVSTGRRLPGAARPVCGLRQRQVSTARSFPRPAWRDRASRVHPLAGQGRDREDHGAASAFAVRASRAEGSTRSSLFQTSICGTWRLDAQRGQDVGHVGGLFGGFGVADVADMQDQVGLQHLFQRGAEGGDQLGRQVRDEAHGVGQDDLAPEGSTTPRIVGSSVANSMSLASTSAPVIRLNSVDLPALV